MNQKIIIQDLIWNENRPKNSLQEYQLNLLPVFELVCTVYVKEKKVNETKVKIAFASCIVFAYLYTIWVALFGYLNSEKFVLDYIEHNLFEPRKFGHKI